MKKLLCLLSCVTAGFVYGSQPAVLVADFSAYLKNVEVESLSFNLSGSRKDAIELRAAVTRYAEQMGRDGLYEAINTILSRIQEDSSFYKVQEGTGLGSSHNTIRQARKLLLVLEYGFKNEKETDLYKARHAKVEEIVNALYEAAEDSWTIGGNGFYTGSCFKPKH